MNNRSQGGEGAGLWWLFKSMDPETHTKSTVKKMDCMVVHMLALVPCFKKVLDSTPGFGQSIYSLSYLSCFLLPLLPKRLQHWSLHWWVHPKVDDKNFHGLCSGFILFQDGSLLKSYSHIQLLTEQDFCFCSGSADIMVLFHSGNLHKTNYSEHEWKS